MAERSAPDRSDLFAVDILQAGILRASITEEGRWRLHSDRAWLLAPTEGLIELHRPGERRPIAVGEVVLTGPDAD